MSKSKLNRITACSYCNAEIAKPCVGKTGKSMVGHHTERIKLRKSQTGLIRQHKTFLTREAYRTVSCPKCKTESFKACIGTKGQERSSCHVERIEVYSGSAVSKIYKRRKKGIVYSVYINSKAWQLKRIERLALSDSFECWTCGTTEFIRGKHVHHRSYKSLGNEDLNDLVITCETCNVKRIPKVVNVIKKNPKLFKDSYQWRATDFVRSVLRFDNPDGSGKRLTLEQQTYLQSCNIKFN